MTLIDTSDTVSVRQQQVILSTVESWELWFKVRSNIAKKLEIEKYIELDKPERTSLIDFSTPAPTLTQYNENATSIAQLTTKQASNYRWAFDIWERDRERERNASKTIRRNLMTLKSEINITIDRRH
jgi:hypothetical protein